MFEIKIIENGYFMADGGAMFGAVPKRAWMRKYPCDENNLCRLAMRSVLAVSDSKRILIDLGMGDKHLDEVKYYQPHALKDIDTSLQEYGYSRADITDIIITHLHFDHCGYATAKSEDGSITPTFPNAKYWLSRKQWDNFCHPNRLEKDAFFDVNIVPVHEAGLLHFIEDDTELYDGLRLGLFDGHSSGQLVAYINTIDGIVAFPGDLIPTAAHLPLEWISAYDISAIDSLNEKVRFLIEAVENEYTLVYCHDAYCVSSKVKHLQNGLYTKKR
ncbi:MBL fold metallo-hydrolase [Dysgonomonas sp. 25]|uniref:MBL fold metallo-hydrolase n=1 Tax=Dysgonomonas sp. 25 TaxID=2302933 RepID=UPI0013D7E64F|nr:MBL fold metallo-hydrolase [Dysgonomonas sp. 25]NDV69670.1 MBL fold metallo-hydrolase [Dysgonomonas sp. 25]